MTRVGCPGGGFEWLAPCLEKEGRGKTGLHLIGTHPEKAVRVGADVLNALSLSSDDTRCTTDMEQAAATAGFRAGRWCTSVTRRVVQQKSHQPAGVSAFRAVRFSSLPRLRWPTALYHSRQDYVRAVLPS